MEELHQTWDHGTFHCVFASAFEVAKHLNTHTTEPQELLREVESSMMWLQHCSLGKQW